MKAIAKQASYTRGELMERHPQLVEAMDELIASDPRRFNSVNIQYCGKYTHPAGSTRRIQLGKVIEILIENGYDINITVNKN